MFIITASLVFGAAPADNNWANFLGASTTLDSQYTAAQWELLDSIIVIKTDTCYTLYTISGVAVLDPNARLYVGFDDGGGAGGLPVDTLIVEGVYPQSGQARIPFTFTYLDSLISTTDANDSIYFYAANGSNATKVKIEDVVLTAKVLDFSAAGVIGE